MPPFVGVVVNTTFTPGQTAPDGDADIVIAGVTGAISDSVPKLVPVVSPAIPLNDEGVILPFADAVDVACTCSPTIENWSEPFVPLVGIVIVMLVGVIVNTGPGLSMFEPVIYVIVGGVAVPNTQPAGALSTSTSVAGPARSPRLPSVSTILPNVVYPGAVPVAAALLQIFVPPVAGVMTTLQYPALPIPHSRAMSRNARVFIRTNLNKMH